MGRPKKITNEELIELYVNQDMSSIKIAKKYNMRVSSVCRRLNSLGIIKPSKGHEGRNGKKGTVYIKGYPVIYMPDHPRAKSSGYVRQHIIEMEKMIGRTPTKEEEIHHIDLDKDNNTPKNLLLLENHREHMSIHKQLVDALHSIGLKRDDGRKAIKNGLIEYRNGMYIVLERTSSNSSTTASEEN